MPSPRFTLEFYKDATGRKPVLECFAMRCPSQPGASSAPPSARFSRNREWASAELRSGASSAAASLSSVPEKATCSCGHSATRTATSSSCYSPRTTRARTRLPNVSRRRSSGHVVAYRTGSSGEGNDNMAFKPYYSWEMGTKAMTHDFDALLEHIDRE